MICLGEFKDKQTAKERSLAKYQLITEAEADQE